MADEGLIPYQPTRVSISDSKDRADDFYSLMNARRSVRHFSDEPVPKELIELAIRTASTAPSGAHRQPWQFVAVSDAKIKLQIKDAAEKEEREFYESGKTPHEWLNAVRPMGTNAEKPYLTIAPWIVVLFEQVHRLDESNNVEKNYYVKESVGIACGLFIAALQNMGLATLTHTPSPMSFLSKLLDRPQNERPFVLFPIGYPATDARVPNLTRKSLDQVSTLSLIHI